VAYLEIIKGDRVGRLVPLDGDRMVIGRHPTCQIVLENAAVSRQHAQVTRQRGVYYVQDLRSRNKTIVNGITIKTPTELHPNDEIRICDVLFRFAEDTFSGSEGGLVAEGTSLAEFVGDDATDHGDGPPEDDRQRREQRRTIEMGIDEPSHQPVISESTGQSTILSKLSASSSSLRLDVRPEEKLRAVLQLASAVANVLNLDQVLAAALEAMFELFPAADEGFVLLRDPITGDLRVDAAKTRPGISAGVRVSRTIVNHVLDEGEAVLSADATKDFDDSQSVSQGQIRSMMCVPLLGKDDVRRGMVQLATRGLASQFKKDDLDVFVSVASQIAVAVENSFLHRELVKQRDLERELAFATQVQMGFLPRERPAVPGYEFYDFYEAALSVGGDYFDYVNLPDGRVVVSLGDVAGKGIPAALLMARLVSAARYHVLSKPHLGEALAVLNDEITDGSLGTRFITYVATLLDPATGDVAVANAGHLQPLVRRADGTVEIMSTEHSGMPLGIVQKQVFDVEVVHLEPGDAILLYTDGVTEAMDGDGDLYRTSGITEYLRDAPASLEEMIEGLVVDVERFSGGGRQKDDLCIVALRRLPADRANGATPHAAPAPKVPIKRRPRTKGDR
jgi:phosphoserine phosphatase RsbU/P